MRILMISLGSTGDVRPYLSLGMELKRRGHEVTLCAFSDFAQQAEIAGLHFAPVNGDARTFISNLMNGSTGVAFLKTVRNTLGDIIDSLIRDIETACSGQDAVIATYFGEVFQAIAEAKGLPFIQTQYAPLDQNSMMPVSSAPGLHAGKVWYESSYKIANLLISALEKTYLSGWRQEEGLPKRHISLHRNYIIHGHTVPVLYAVSPQLLPRPAEWAGNIYITGYWTSPEEEYHSNEKLENFLKAGPAPIYIGFGSMSNDDIRKTYGIILKALKLTGQRAILASGWSEFSGESNKNWYFMKEFVPHSWIFQHVCAVVHHGGAGTTHAGLLYGKPTLIIPFGGDQPFWGNRVHALGAGPKPIPRNKLGAHRLARALTRLVSNRDYVKAAQLISRKMQEENGVFTAAQIIERELSAWPAAVSSQAKPEE